MSLQLVIIFSFVGLFTILIPNSFVDSMRIGRTTALYKKIGVDFINKVTQNGSMINKLIRKKHPGYKVVSSDRRSFIRLIKQSYFFEKFHWVLFVFFTLTTIYALHENYMTWVLILFVTNLIYNVYPSLLQQYIRLKLEAVSKRMVP